MSPVPVVRGGVRLGLVLAVLLLAVPSVQPAHAGADAADIARRALAECEAGRLATARSERLARFGRGEELARQAVAADGANANAHFAVFCNMGEAMRVDGETLQALVGLGKLMHELDRTLDLDPNHLDAMAAKGTLLTRLPRVFGGDVARGESMLRRVVREDPNAFTSRIALARVCQERGEHEEAVRFATRALEIAKARNRPEKIAEARELLAKLGATAN